MLSSTDMADPSSREVSTSGTAAYIEHTVSMLDTLAGIAIKYGVEVRSTFKKFLLLPLRFPNIEISSLIFVPLLRRAPRFFSN